MDTLEPAHTLGLRSSTRHLRAALRANTLFSLTTGITLVAGGWPLAAAWHLSPAWPVALLGAGLVAFAVLVARVAVRPGTALRRQAHAVVAADLAWLAATGAALTLTDAPTGAAIAMVAVGAVVTLLTGWQLYGLAAAHADDPLADFEVVEAHRSLPAGPQQVWPLLTDHDLYGRLAPNLSKVEVISAPGQPLRRRCTNNAGNSWEEHCTLFDGGHRFAVTVNTSDYPYPLATMRGLWQVDAHPDGSHVTMRFTYQPHATIRGGLFAIAFRPLFRPALDRIFTGWRQRLRIAIPRRTR